MSELREKVVRFPKSAGVYLMKGAFGEVLYVGKAKSLRARVLSYFSEHHDGRQQIRFLMKKAIDIEPIVTHNEKEALLLENTLIKKHKPPYNILLKDNKSFLSLKLTTRHPYPRLWITRNPIKDGSTYFGPYPSAFRARKVADFIEEHFRLRSCTDAEFSNRTRPCIQYQIRRCDAPCVGYISKEGYEEVIRQVQLFLKGKNDELIDTLLQKMEKASDILNFEEAARLRDLVEAIRTTLEPQKVVTPFSPDRDLIGLYREGDRISFAVLKYREGNLSDQRTYLFKSYLDSSEVLESFLLQYYQEPGLIPREILLSIPMESQDALREILAERKGQAIHLKTPEKGVLADQIRMANQNAKDRLLRQAVTHESRLEALRRLQEGLGLSKLPRRMECYDISNLQGQLAVGSCVCFVDGEPEKSGYRRFKIKTVKQANDFAMLYEVLMRRLDRKEWALPDLIVIDGGKGQLSSAQSALKDRKIEGVDLISLAKEREGVIQPASGESSLEEFETSETGETALGKTPRMTSEKKPAKKPERVFLPNQKNPIILHLNSPELQVLVRIRDEAHRFGITFHRNLRIKKGLTSILDQIPGIGPVRRKQLIKHFGSVKKLAQASLEEIEKVPQMTHPLAQEVYEHLHPKPQAESL